MTRVWHEYSDKPHGTLRIPGDGKWHSIDARCKAAPVDGLELHMLYVNLTVEWKAGARKGSVTCRYVRENDPDGATSYEERDIYPGNRKVYFTQTHWEAGKAGVGGHWQLRTEGDIDHLVVGTRYSKAGGVG